MEGLAEPGGICISGSAFDQVKNKLSIGFDDMGPQEVKNIPEPVPAFRVVPSPVSLQAKAPSGARRWWMAAIAAAVVVIIAAGGLAVWRPWEPTVDTTADALPLPDKPSLAVLPFTNMSGDPEQEYFADGMTEDLITDLSKVSGLFVIARNSSFTYKGKSVDVKQIARELGVKYVLEGSVRRAGDEVRINAQLVEAASGGHLWADRYDGSMSDVFALQDQVTSKIVTALVVELEAGRQGYRKVAETPNSAAYDAFLKGMEHSHRRTIQDLPTAISYFDKAIELDGEYARAHAARAAAYWLIYEQRWHLSLNLSRNAVMNRVLESLNAAMANPTPLAHQVAAELHLSLGSYDEANEEAERALSLDPNNADSYATLANVLIWRGRPEEAVDLVKQAMRLNPKSSVTHYQFLLGLAKFGLEQYEEAAELLEAMVKANPEWEAGGVFLVSVYGHLNRHQKAMTEMSRLDQLALPGLVSSGLSLVGIEGSVSFEHLADQARLLEGLQGAGMPDALPYQPPSRFSIRQGK